MQSNIIEEIPLETIREKIIEFRDGLPGFPQNRRFVMAQRPDEKPFVWMHSLTQPFLHFALVDAYAWDKDYMLEIDDEELEEMGSLDPMDYAVYFILRIQKHDDRTTIEAQADSPIVVNVRTRQARQVVSTRNRLAETPTEAEPLCLQH